MYLRKKKSFTRFSVFLISAILLLFLHCVVSKTLAASNVEEEEEDLYEILGLGKEREDATEQDIKAAWRKQTRKHHPDVSKGADSQIYERIRRAYDVLGNRKKRKMYDIMGHKGVQKLEQPEGQQRSSMQNFFSFFGGGGGGEGGSGKDEELLLLVSLEDVYKGATHSVKLPRTKICRACRGSGARSKSDMKRCPQCRGEGRVVRRLQLAPGFVQQVEQTCDHCGGGGRVVAENCAVCGGKRVVRDYSTINIDIKRGVPDGHRIVHELEGDQKPDEVPGDVIFTLTTATHQLFERNGDDLTVMVQLTLKDALIGFKKELQHIDGHVVKLVEVGVTQHLTRRVIVGEGMPKHEDSSKYGNLNVIYKIVLPNVLTEKQIEVVRRLLR